MFLIDALIELGVPSKADNVVGTDRLNHGWARLIVRICNVISTLQYNNLLARCFERHERRKYA